MPRSSLSIRKRGGVGSPARKITPEYGYQGGLINRAYRHLMDDKIVVLAAAPGAGKTKMAIEIVNRFVESRPKAVVFIFAHAQTILRQQWADFLVADLRWVDHRVLQTAQDVEAATAVPGVHVVLPQTMATVDPKRLGRVDLLVVDEAHQHYLASRVQGLLKRLKPGHQLLLTGTPSVYLKDKSIPVVGICISEMLKHGVVCDPLIEIVKSEYDFKLSDLNTTALEIETRAFTEEKTIQTMDRLVHRIADRLAARDRHSSSARQWQGNTRTWSHISARLGKTMVVCRTVKQAKVVHACLGRAGVGSILSVSEKHASRAGLGTHAASRAAYVTDTFDRFKSDPRIKFLIVCQRGILGFNMSELMSVIDMSGSHHVDRIFQLLCRVVRRGGSAQDRKIYIKVTSEELLPLTYFVMSYTVALSLPEYYYSYHSRRTEIPVRAEFVAAVAARKAARTSGSAAVQFPDLPHVYSFSDIERAAGTAAVSYTSLAKTISALSTNTQWTVEAFKAALDLCRTRTDYHNDHRLHGVAVRNGWLHIVDARFGATFRWDKESALAEWKKYKSVGAFRRGSPGAFNWLKRNGIPVSYGKVVNLSDDVIEAMLKDPNVSVFPDGRVLINGRPPISKKSGKLCVKYRGRSVIIGRLVYRKFVGPLLVDHQLCHRDGDPLNAHPNNLVQVPRGKNISKKPPIRGGLKTLRKHEEVVAMRREGASYAEICKRFKLAKSTVSHICTKGKVSNG